jgi:hypothetical protein
MTAVRNEGRNDTTRHPFFVAVSEWLNGPEAKTVADGLARRSGFNINPDDLRADVLRKIWSRVRKNDEGLEEMNIAAYCTKSMRNALSTAAQGRLDLDSFDDTSAIVSRGILGDHESFGQVSSSGAFSRDLRTAIELDSSLATWVAAAALNAITLTMHPDVDVSGASKPLAGSPPSTALLWPSLWFSGKRDRLFPDADGDSTAKRQRRRRTMQQVSNAIDAARMRVEAGAASHG